MKIVDEDGRLFAEYENEEGAKVYTDLERHLVGEDFSDRIEVGELSDNLQSEISDGSDTLVSEANIPDSIAEDVKQEASGITGFELMSEQQKKELAIEKLR